LSGERREERAARQRREAEKLKKGERTTNATKDGDTLLVPTVKRVKRPFPWNFGVRSTRLAFGLGYINLNRSKLELVQDTTSFGWWTQFGRRLGVTFIVRITYP